MSTQTDPVPIATALRESRRGYTLARLKGDLIAGLTVGIVAVPLSMALAIASGVPPQHGLYTAIIAGALIALFGGSRVNISGPTAAFVVILFPITEQYGLGGLLLATVMAGVMLVAFGLARMGRLIEYIPYPVTTGFTAGIAVVIATLQIKDLLGLTVSENGGHFFEKLVNIAQALPTAHLPDMAVGLFTLSFILFWQWRRLPLPAFLAGLVVSSALTVAVSYHWTDLQIATIGSRFHSVIDGVLVHGIPQALPHWVWPWELPNAQGQAVGFNFDLLRALIGPAFAIALLGAIESLLCAVVADGMAGTKHNPNSELIGQGIGNIVVPFFGGITATAAISRTATNIRSGATSPLASVVHAMIVLLAIVLLAPLLSYVPMASLAAILIVVAWNLGDAKHFAYIVRVAPKHDVAVLLTCFSLTVIFDMVIAVTVGVVLAALLFIKRMSDITGVKLHSSSTHPDLAQLPKHVLVYDINGPLFFGAAEKAMAVIQRITSNVTTIVLDLGDVPMIDITGMVAMKSLVKKVNQSGVDVVIANLSTELIEHMVRAGLAEDGTRLRYCPDASCIAKLIKM